jgi:thioredoxin reductase (NADPH)
MTNIYDTIILGGGVGGLSAAIYTGRDAIKTLLIEGELVSNTELPGGALMLTESIENFPGYSGTGEGLIELLRSQVDALSDVERVEGLAVSFVRLENGLVEVGYSEYGDEPTLVLGKSILISTGAVSRKLGVPGEDEFYGRGVSTCATCDGAFYKDKVVGVVGGGDTAVEDALYLTRHASKVKVFVRSDKLRTNSPEARELLKHEKVEIIWNTAITSINGENTVTSVNTKTNGADDAEPVVLDGLFVAIGRDPNTAFLSDSGLRLSDGYLVTDSAQRCSAGDGTVTPNIFAVGDVADAKYVQAITAAGDAVKAALGIREHLMSH